MFRDVIKKLHFKYHPEDFKNPALQKLWNEIEAIALAREESEEVNDLSIPNLQRIEKKVGHMLAEFSQIFDLDNLSKGKRKPVMASAHQDSEQPKKRAKTAGDEVNVESEGRAGRVKKLRIFIQKNIAS